MVTKKPLLIVMWGALLALLLVLPLGAAQSMKYEEELKWKKQLGACTILDAKAISVLYVKTFRVGAANSCSEVYLYNTLSKKSVRIFGQKDFAKLFVMTGILTPRGTSGYFILTSSIAQARNQRVIYYDFLRKTHSGPLFDASKIPNLATIMLSPDNRFLGFAVEGMILTYSWYRFGPLGIKDARLVGVGKNSKQWPCTDNNDALIDCKK